ncbi:MAG: tetratricopeptide repeat protein, partial [Rhodospirillales bacterium]
MSHRPTPFGRAAVAALLAAPLGAAPLFVGALVAGPAAAQAPAVRDTLGNEAIGLMIDNAGDGQAEALLGVLYLRGVRIDPDPIAALAWFTRAANDGHPAGVYGAARMLAEGVGVPADPDRARALLRDRPPSAFGALADAVRQLRLSLDLPPEPGSPPPPAPM